MRKRSTYCREKNVIVLQLVPRDKILLPSLHIKLGLMKQFVKAPDKDGDCFQNTYRVLQA